MHYFESGCFSNGQPAWHKLGRVLPAGEFMTVDNCIALSGCVDPIKVPVYTDDGEVVKGFWALRRPDNGKTHAMVGDQYTIETMEHSLELMQALLEYTGKLQIETIMSLKEGAVMTICARLEEFNILGDVFFPFLSLANYHGGGSRRVGAVNIRPVCWNTYSSGEAINRQQRRLYTSVHKKGSLKISEENLKTAREILLLAELKGESLKILAEKLAGIKMDKTNFTQLLNVLFPDPDPVVELEKHLASKDDIAKEVKAKEVFQRALEIVNEKRSLLVRAATADDLANFKNTAWGALGAVTAFASHVTTGTSTTRPEVKQARTETRFLELMDGSKLEATALDFLLQLA